MSEKERSCTGITIVCIIVSMFKTVSNNLMKKLEELKI